MFGFGKGSGGNSDAPEVHASMPFESIFSMLEPEQESAKSPAAPTSSPTSMSSPVNGLLEQLHRSQQPNSSATANSTTNSPVNNSRPNMPTDMASTVNLLQQLYIQRLNIELLSSLLAANKQAQQRKQPIEHQQLQLQMEQQKQQLQLQMEQQKEKQQQDQQLQQQQMDRVGHSSLKSTPKLFGSSRSESTLFGGNATTNDSPLHFLSNFQRSSAKETALHPKVNSVSGRFNPEDFSPRYQRNNKKGGLKNLRCFPKCSCVHRDRGFCGRSCLATLRKQHPSVNFSEVMCWAQFVCLETNPTPEASQSQSPPSRPEDIAPGHQIELSQLLSLERNKDNRFKPWVKGEIVHRYSDGSSASSKRGDNASRVSSIGGLREEREGDFDSFDSLSSMQSMASAGSFSSCTSWSTARGSVSSTSTYHTARSNSKPSVGSDEVMFEFNRQRWGWHYSWISNKYSCDSRHCLRVYVFLPAFPGSSQMVCVDVFESPPFVLFCRRRRKVMQELTEADAKLAERKRPNSTLDEDYGDDDEEDGEESDASEAFGRKNKMPKRSSSLVQ